MCRHLAYVGEPVALAGVISEPERGLLEQTWAPRDMRGGGTINADGFGAGWWQRGEQVRYRSVHPMWADSDFLHRAGSLRASAFLAAVRSATPGMATTHTACAPFADGTWLFSHNGRIAGWPGAVTDLAGGLDATRLLTMDAPTDSAFLWALVRARLAEGRDPVSVVVGTVRDVADRAPESRLNLLLTDGERIIATTWSHSLWTGRGGNAALVSSEPFALDGGTTAWSEVPDGSLVLADRHRTTVQPLPAAPEPGAPAARADHRRKASTA
ncbi:ergothioneine biosynthesis protein EgtC [Salinifilum ghardaiensis]